MIQHHTTSKPQPPHHKNNTTSHHRYTATPTPTNNTALRQTKPHTTLRLRFYDRPTNHTIPHNTTPHNHNHDTTQYRTMSQLAHHSTTPHDTTTHRSTSLKPLFYTETAPYYTTPHHTKPPPTLTTTTHTHQTTAPYLIYMKPPNTISHHTITIPDYAKTIQHLPTTPHKIIHEPTKLHDHITPSLN